MWLDAAFLDHLPEAGFDEVAQGGSITAGDLLRFPNEPLRQDHGRLHMVNRITHAVEPYKALGRAQCLAARTTAGHDLVARLPDRCRPALTVTVEDDRPAPGKDFDGGRFPAWVDRGRPRRWRWVDA